MSNKLLPCPFCGGEAKYDKSKGYDYIICDECGARNFAFTKEQAFNEWNARVDVSLTRSDIEKMVKPLEELSLFKEFINKDALIISGCYSINEIKPVFRNWIVDLVCSALGVEE